MTDAEWAAALESQTPITGWYTFLHHMEPIEWTDDLGERLRYIDRAKPVHELAIRRRCIVAVPEERLPAGYAEARRVYFSSRQFYAWERVYAEARGAVRGELLALALELVPDAPWVEGALRFES